MNAAEVAKHLRGAKRMGPGWLACCPTHDDRNPSLSIADGDGDRLLVHCYAGCEPLDILAAIRSLGLGATLPASGSAVAPIPKAAVNHGDLVETIWRQAVPITATLAEQYLNRRGLTVSADVADLRFHPACPRGPERYPAMIAAFRDIYSDEVCGLHRTFLTAGATKIGSSAKMMLGRVTGAAIKLSPSDQVETGLHISEGIETALALIGFGFAPGWALGSAGAILNFPVLAGIEALTIAVDQDAAGQKSATACGERWRAADRDVWFVRSLTAGNDIADLAESEVAA